MRYVLTLSVLGLAVAGAVACSEGGGKIPINRNLDPQGSEAGSRFEVLSKAASESSDCFRLDRLVAELLKPEDALYSIYTVDLDLGEAEPATKGSDVPPFRSTADALTRGMFFLKGDLKPGLESLTARELKSSSQVGKLLSLAPLGQEGCGRVTFAEPGTGGAAREFRILNSSSMGLEPTPELEPTLEPTPEPSPGPSAEPSPELTSNAVIKPPVRNTPTRRARAIHTTLLLKSMHGDGEYRLYSLIRGRNQLLVTTLKPVSVAACGAPARYLLKESYAVDWAGGGKDLSVQRRFVELLTEYVQEPAEVKALLAPPAEESIERKRKAAGSEAPLSYPAYAYLLSQVHAGQFENLECPQD